MFECDTICLMYLLCCSFKSVTVNKPATSKEGNSEVYVICLEYRGAHEMSPWLSVLDAHYGKFAFIQKLVDFDGVFKQFSRLNQKDKYKCCCEDFYEQNMSNGFLV